MRILAKAGILMCMAASFMFAENYSGKLIDANCKPDPSKKEASCAPTQTTTSFAVETPDGKIYRLDSSGNSKAMAAMKQNPASTTVTVSGSLDGQTLKVESLDLR